MAKNVEEIWPENCWLDELYVPHCQDLALFFASFITLEIGERSSFFQLLTKLSFLSRP